ncbi:unnamed protein product, partial [Meganyctiphanes norvegica]
KDQLAKFLLKEWQKDQYGPILDNKTLFVSYGGNCVHLTFNELEVKIVVEHPDHLQGSHEEADTLLAFHAANSNGNIVVRASDTDVMVILLGMLGRHMENHRETSYQCIILDCGSGNTRQHIDVSKIASVLESTQKGLAAVLPGLHAFTDCDFTTAFYRKGKVKPLEVLQKDTAGTLIKLFSKLSSDEDPLQSKAEEFICSLYGMKDGINTVNEARYAKLLQMTGKIKDQETPLVNLKKVDCALLPPCLKTVHKKIQRAHYVSILWGNADSPYPGHGLDPVNYGWILRNGYYAPDWFSGPSISNDLFQESDQGDESMENFETDE